MLKVFFLFIGKSFYFLNPFWKLWRSTKAYIYTGYYSCFFSKFGQNSLILPTFQMVRGLNNIEIGNNCILGQSLQLTLWKNSQYPNAKIIIGDNCAIGDNSHVTAINNISIGNNVLMGKRILITDNAHGSSDLSLVETAPNQRPLSSKGAVVIEDNVWIGEKTSIMPGVIIGKGAIIGANSVVTKNLPPYSVAVGNPAKVVKLIK